MKTTAEDTTKPLVNSRRKKGEVGEDRGDGRDALGRLVKGRGRKANVGRTSGVPNRVTQTFKDMVMDTVQGLGPKELMRFAKKDPATFYKIAARLIPQQREVSGPGGAPIERRDVTEYSEAELLAILEAPAQGSDGLP